jgi:hypothetical protein
MLGVPFLNPNSTTLGQNHPPQTAASKPIVYSGPAPGFYRAASVFEMNCDDLRLEMI